VNQGGRRGRGLAPQRVTKKGAPQGALLMHLAN